MRSGTADEPGFAGLRARIQEVLDKAETFALASVPPDVQTAEADVYGVTRGLLGAFGRERVAICRSVKRSSSLLVPGAH